MSDAVSPSDLHAVEQAVSKSMAEDDVGLPVAHHVYREVEGDEGTVYVRLCDEEIRADELPFETKPIDEGWSNPDLIGIGYSCSDCGPVVSDLVGGS